MLITSNRRSPLRRIPTESYRVAVLLVRRNGDVGWLGHRCLVGLAVDVCLQRDILLLLVAGSVATLPLTRQGYVGHGEKLRLVVRRREVTVLSVSRALPSICLCDMSIG